ncbi:MAG TPA: hypothetical protein VG777_04915 [Thermoanaerobaculia bacterium]|nr:hypothetical protein [Thermoanaerobaculia bacterium]
MDQPEDRTDGKIADEMRLLGDSLFQLGKIAFSRGRAFSIDALRKARAAVEKAAEELEKTGKR